MVFADDSRHIIFLAVDNESPLHQKGTAYFSFFLFFSFCVVPPHCVLAVLHSLARIGMGLTGKGLERKGLICSSWLFMPYIHFSITFLLPFTYLFESFCSSLAKSYVFFVCVDELTFLCYYLLTAFLWLAADRKRDCLLSKARYPLKR